MRSVKPLLLPVVAVGLLLAAGPASAEMGGEINLLLGQKTLSDDTLDEIEDEEGLDLTTQFEYGITSSFGNVDWPVAIAVDLLMGNSDDSYTYDGDGYLYRYTIDVDTTELNAGVRKFWTNNEKWQPYVGGGVAWVKAKLKLSYFEEFATAKQQTFSDSASVDDSAIGFWANGGVMWRFHDKMSLGLDVRYTDAEVEFDVSDFDKQGDPLKVDAGGFHYGLLFGYRW